MTQDQLNKAKSLQAEIDGCKKHLDRVIDFIDRIPEACVRGICISNGLKYDTNIVVPREKELNDMLVAMRNRLEKRIAELEREFAEL